MTYCWHFGDQSNHEICTNSEVFNYTYKLAGIYNVTLSVIDNLNSTSQDLSWQTVFVNQHPFASFSIVNRTDAGTITLEANSIDCYDLDGVITIFIWNFGDYSPVPQIDNLNYQNKSVVQHTFTQGFFNITLIVRDNYNFSRHITQQIYVAVD